MWIAALLIGIALGGAVGWLLRRGEVQALEARVESERTAAQANEQWERRFEQLSAKALRDNSESFLQLAGAKFDPLQSTLKTLDEHTRGLETARQGAYAELTTQVQSLAGAQQQLRSETGALVTALRAPDVRGRWGEMQLKRTVEAAGMLEYCDFVRQESATEDGRRLRPDLIVKLPGGRNVIVDAKTPLQALLDALDDRLDEGQRTAKLADFKRHVRDHVAQLSAKSYWQQFTPTPDFVILFLPGESFYRTAIQEDPALLDLHASARVIIASPTTLITLLRAIAVGWREEKIAESARAVSELGRELYERLATMVDHFARVGKGLDTAVQAYNQTVGSLERRVLVSARRFPEHGIATGKQIAELAPVDKSTQQPQTIELPTRPAADAA
jgi:DNA recombination protein RmuC